MTSRFLATLVAAGWIAATAPGASLAEERHPTDLLVLALNADITSSNPGIDRDSNSDTVLHHVIEGLVAHREDLSVAPMLAESWEISDDGKTYSFKLRDGLTFHNGQKVTSEDVKWSFQRYIDPANAWQCTYRYDGSYGPNVDAIETPDPLTVVFHLSRADGMFLTNLASVQCLAAVLHKDSLNADGSWNKPIGTGPYMFDDWQRERHIDLVRFPDYQSLPGERDGLAGAKIAHAERVRFLVVPDASSRKSALYAGQLDVITGLPPTDIEEAKGRGIQVEVAPSMAWEMLLFQTADPLLSNVKLRQAIAHAIDIGQVTEGTTFGLGKPNPSAVASMSPYHTAVHDAWPAYDLEKAKALLAEAGYDGQVIKIQANQKYDEMYTSAVTIQALLAASGIQAEIEVLDWATHLDNFSSGKFQLSSFGYSARLDPALMYETFVCPKSIDPSCMWEDPKAFELLTESMLDLDPAKRQAIFDEMHGMMAEQVPLIGLYNDPLISAAAANVHGFKDWPAAKSRLWGVWKG
jgi:peptide/nickel transport system substrate-binding protein